MLGEPNIYAMYETIKNPRCIIEDYSRQCIREAVIFLKREVPELKLRKNPTDWSEAVVGAIDQNTINQAEPLSSGMFNCLGSLGLL